jgi:hypothetical protein
MTTTHTTIRHEVEVDRRIAAASEALHRAERSLELSRKIGRQPHLDEAEETHAQALVAYREVAKEFRGWSRFFLVSGGHIHHSTHCHTIRLTTQVGWLPDLSGLTEAEAVEEHGEILCSHCFPHAPVAWTNGVSKQSIADKALRAIAKTPEGKAVIKAQRDLDRIERDIKYATSNIEGETEWRDRYLAEGDTDLAERVTARIEASQRVIAKATKALPKAKAKAEAAEAALIAALNA